MSDGKADHQTRAVVCGILTPLTMTVALLCARYGDGWSAGFSACFAGTFMAVTIYSLVAMRR